MFEQDPAGAGTPAHFLLQPCSAGGQAGPNPTMASLQIPTATGDKLFALEEVEKVPKCADSVMSVTELHGPRQNTFISS